MDKQISYKNIIADNKEFLKENNNKDFTTIINKDSKVLLSVPHSVSQVRLGKYKPPEPGSLKTGLLLQKNCNCNLIVKTKNNFDDANFDVSSPYKNEIDKFIIEKKVQYVLDLHALKKSRECDINLGVYFGRTVNKDVALFDRLFNLLTESGFCVTIDQPFNAGINTITGSTKLKHKNIWTVQIEINSKITTEFSNYNRYIKLLKVLTQFINQL